MKLIAITGMPGSGKKSVREALEKKGIPVVVMRSVIEDKLKEKNLPITNENLREFATEYREEHGYDIVARETFERAKSLDEDIIIIDGIRGDMEIEFFKSQEDIEFIMIAVIANEEIRFKRLTERGKSWDMKTWDEFIYRDNKELSWGLNKAIEMADYKIENNGTLEEFEEKINKVIEKIL